MKTILNKIIILNIKEIRYKKNITQSELAKKTLLDINKIENNKKIISIKELHTISNKLNVDINCLLKVNDIKHTIIYINKYIQKENLKDNKIFVNNLFKFIDSIYPIINKEPLSATLTINKLLTKKNINKLKSKTFNIKSIQI